MLIYAIDTRLYLWLKHCESVALDQREIVDDSLIDFTQMQSNILTGNFYQELPSCIRQASSKSARKSQGANFSDSESDDGGGKKRSKKTKASAGKSTADDRQIKNPDPVSAWTVDLDTYKAKFAGKNLKKRVKWGDRHMCVRYFTVGHCFDDCFNLLSHVKKQSDIPADKKSAFTAFHKLCHP
jgi:hypothetical protein